MFKQHASPVPVYLTTTGGNVNRYFRMAAMLDWRLTFSVDVVKYQGGHGAAFAL
jgi:hypothetical protein